MKRESNQRGVALLMVLFIISLATSLVVGLTYSTFLQSRSIGLVERQLQAEYLLKSMLEFSAAVINSDQDTRMDTYHDVWGAFREGTVIPPDIIELLGISYPGIQIALEIAPVDGKIKLRTGRLTQDQSQPGERQVTRDMVLTLFRNLGFDDDDLTDHTGYFPDRPFDSAEMLVNLIDAIDRDNESFNESGFPAGVEDALPDDYLPNTAGSKNGFKKVRELVRIPGFHPQRLQLMLPYVTLDGSGKINVNIAPERVLKALHPNVANALADIRARRADPENPLTANEFIDLVFPSDPQEGNDVKNLLTQNSSSFTVIGKVAFGTSSIHFIRGTLDRSGGEVDRVTDVVFF